MSKSGKTKAPAFQFYAADFLSDGAVMEMTYEERGVYITLLATAWLEGGIPADQGRLARVLRMSAEKLTELWPAIEPCWSKRGVRLVNSRMERERQRLKEYRERASEAGKKGGKASAVTRASKAESKGQLNDRSSEKQALHPSASTSVVKDVSVFRDESGLSPERYPLSFLLADLVERNGSKRPTVTKAWGDAERLMLSADERPHLEAEALIHWCQKDEFWRSNVLSMPKFREKYDQLRLKHSATNGPKEETSERPKRFTHILNA